MGRTAGQLEAQNASSPSRPRLTATESLTHDESRILAIRGDAREIPLEDSSADLSLTRFSGVRANGRYSRESKDRVG